MIPSSGRTTLKVSLNLKKKNFIQIEIPGRKNLFGTIAGIFVLVILTKVFRDRKEKKTRAFSHFRDF